MKWIDPKDRKPISNNVFWAIVKGRIEQSNGEGFIYDTSIHLLQDLDDPRELDCTTSHYWTGSDKYINVNYEIIAWMPYEDMEFPDFVKEYLKKE